MAQASTLHEQPLQRDLWRMPPSTSPRGAAPAAGGHQQSRGPTVVARKTLACRRQPGEVRSLSVYGWPPFVQPRRPRRPARAQRLTSSPIATRPAPIMPPGPCVPALTLGEPRPPGIAVSRNRGRLEGPPSSDGRVQAVAWPGAPKDPPPTPPCARAMPVQRSVPLRSEPIARLSEP